MPPIAAEYPLLNIIWTMFVFFLFVFWLMIVFKVIIDIFRRKDCGGGTKTLWLIFVIFLPFLGVFMYLITQGQHMAERDAEQMMAQKQELDEYVRGVAGGAGGAAGEIAQANKLLADGTITQEEFDKIKAKALAA
jgi:preprotein translocase subunit YajC